jgi:hypothetical protein
MKYFSTIHNNIEFTQTVSTFERPYNGGDEFWIFKINDKQTVYYSNQIFSLNVLPEFYENNQKLKEYNKISLVSFYTDDSRGISRQGVNNIYSPTNTLGYDAIRVLKNVIKLTIEIIEPMRKYRYILLPGYSSIKKIYEYIIKKHGQNTDPITTELILKCLQQHNYTSVNNYINSIENSHLLIGDLYPNKIWQKNNLQNTGAGIEPSTGSVITWQPS